MYDYLGYLEDAYLVTKAGRYDIIGKKALETLHKYYAIDPIFITIRRGGRTEDMGMVLETVVYNELLSRGYEVFIGKTRKGEIDFAVRKDGRRCYLQAAYLLSSQETVSREFGAYAAIRDNYPKYVLSLDKADMGRDGIQHINIIDFLLGKQSLAFL